MADMRSQPNCAMIIAYSVESGWPISFFQSAQIVFF